MGNLVQYERTDRVVLVVTFIAAFIGLSALLMAGTASAAPSSTWDRVAQCESGGRWNTNTGNGYSGGLQFSPSTWRAHGGKGNPANASREQQIAVAERVLASQGWGAWPECSKKANATAHRPEAKIKTSSKSKSVYRVTSGDTLSKVAARHGTSVQRLMKLNPGVDSQHRIYVGQSLRL